MLRLHDLDLTDAAGNTRHPDDIEAALADLFCFRSAPPCHPEWKHEDRHPFFENFWHLLLWFDPEERLKSRAKQKMQLGRYGHQSFYQWEDKPLSDLDEAYAALAEIMSAESASQSHSEDMR